MSTDKPGPAKPRGSSPSSADSRRPLPRAAVSRGRAAPAPAPRPKPEKAPEPKPSAPVIGSEPAQTAPTDPGPQVVQHPPEPLDQAGPTPTPTQPSNTPEATTSEPPASADGRRRRRRPSERPGNAAPWLTGSDQPVRETPIFTVPPDRRGSSAPGDPDARVTSTRLRRGRPSSRGTPEGAAQQARRSARDLSSLSKEIYTAPPGSPAGPEAQVTVSTRLRKPKVHLTAPTTALRVDLERYMGRWYEIARLPYFTQRRCVKDVHADYLLGDDGLVYVTNRCTHADGGVGSAKGIARVTDPGSNVRLQISFRMLYGVHVFWDDYWIIGLGDDYEYALVGQPTRRRGWILARDPQPSETDIQRWMAEFAAKGFAAEAFLRTRQEWPTAD